MKTHTHTVPVAEAVCLVGAPPPYFDESSSIFCCGFFKKPDLAMAATVILKNHPDMDITSLQIFSQLYLDSDCIKKINADKIKHLTNKFIIDMSSNTKWTKTEQDNCIAQFSKNMESALGIPQLTKELRRGQAFTLSDDQVASVVFGSVLGGFAGGVAVSVFLEMAAIVVSTSLFMPIFGSAVGVLAILSLACIAISNYNEPINDNDPTLQKLTQAKNDALDPFIASVKKEFPAHNPLAGLGICKGSNNGD